MDTLEINENETITQIEESPIVYNEEKIKEEEDKKIEEPKSHDFCLDENEQISDDDIKQMLFLFAVNEKIPMHYKQILAKIINVEKFKKNEKIEIFNSICYCWQMLKQEKELTQLEKILMIRKLHKLIFGKFNDY
jgi:hypothetical protein